MERTDGGVVTHASEQWSKVEYFTMLLAYVGERFECVDFLFFYFLIRAGVAPTLRPFMAWTILRLLVHV